MMMMHSVPFMQQIPQDPYYKSNIDRFIEATTPIMREDPSKMTLSDLFKMFEEPSIFGLKLEAFNDQTSEPEVLTFLPTLSSIYVKYFYKDNDVFQHQH